MSSMAIRLMKSLLPLLLLPPLAGEQRTASTCSCLRFDPPTSDTVPVGAQVLAGCVIENLVALVTHGCVVNNGSIDVRSKVGGGDCYATFTAESEGPLELTCSALCCTPTRSDTYTPTMTSVVGAQGSTTSSSCTCTGTYMYTNTYTAEAATTGTSLTTGLTPTPPPPTSSITSSTAISSPVTPLTTPPIAPSTATEGSGVPSVSPGGELRPREDNGESLIDVILSTTLPVITFVATVIVLAIVCITCVYKKRPNCRTEEPALPLQTIKTVGEPALPLQTIKTVGAGTCPSPKDEQNSGGTRPPPTDDQDSGGTHPHS